VKIGFAQSNSGRVARPIAQADMCVSCELSQSKQASAKTSAKWK
jgi:hypothetical protein